VFAEAGPITPASAQPAMMRRLKEIPLI
jgi:hypothetical protein